MSPQTFWRMAIGGLVVVLSAVLLAFLAARANAAPPPGGFKFELVIDARTGGGEVTVYRFRDGSRVCYVAAANGVSDTISCVVSP